MHGTGELLRAPTADLIRGRVLLIVEDLAFERLYAPLLGACGCEVVSVRGEAGALERLRADRAFEAVIAHLRGAAENDFALCRRLRTDPTARALPLLLITSGESEAEQALGRAGQDAGADAVIFARQPPAAIARAVRLHLRARPVTADLPATAGFGPRARSSRIDPLGAAWREPPTSLRRHDEELQAAREEAARLARESDELRRQVTRLEAANAELGAFNERICHDLRNALVSMASFSTYLNEELVDGVDQQHRVYLQRLRKASERALSLLGSLGRLSAVNQRALRAEPVDIGLFAREILLDLREREPNRRVDVRIEPDLVAAGDPELLWELLQNLLSNAWKFTRGRASAHIEIGAREEAGERAIFVRDDGLGFPDERAADLFRPFTRIHGREDLEGHGIGLSTAERIVRRHGGRLWAHGSPGNGAVFWFTLGVPPG